MLLVDELDDLAFREHGAADVEPSISGVECKLSSIKEITKLDLLTDSLCIGLYTPNSSQSHSYEILESSNSEVHRE